MQITFRNMCSDWELVARNKKCEKGKEIFYPYHHAPSECAGECRGESDHFIVFIEDSWSDEGTVYCACVNKSSCKFIDNTVGTLTPTVYIFKGKL